MRKGILSFLMVLFLSLSISGATFADSSYVLPYPSVMPGSIWYKLDLVKELLMKYWYFGDFAQFSYNLGESDKYLVEAKTLFEYKQYLLGYKAMLKSDQFFMKIPSNLTSALRHGKDVSEKRIILRSASEKHIAELQKIRPEVPRFYNWQPEKSNPTYIRIWDLLDQSIRIRNSVL